MKTVGQALRTARNDRNVTLHEAERATKIRLETLQDLEGDNFEGLPSTTHIKGFITLYGEWLGLDPQTLLALFRRQYDEKQTTFQVLPDLSPRRRPKLMLTPSRAFGLGISLLVLAFLGYLVAQYQSFAAAPAVELSSPSDNSKVNNGTVEVTGRTDRDAKLSINGQRIDLTSSGAFSVSVTLPDGTNDLSVSAVNKLGRVTTVKRTVTVTTAVAPQPLGPAVAAIATASATPAVQPPAKPVGLQVVLKIGPSPAYLQIITDQGYRYCGIVSANLTKTLTADTKIDLKTGNAGSTDLVINGTDKGVMGADGQVVIHEITAQSDSVLPSLPACNQ